MAHISRYLYAKTVDTGLVGVYNAFGHSVTFLGLEEWQAVQQCKPERTNPAALARLGAQDFLVEEGFEEAALQRFRASQPGINEMWLVLVQGCNMACQYCVTEGNVRDPRRRRFRKSSSPLDSDRTNTEQAPQVDVMPTDVADAAIDKFIRYVRNSHAALARVVLYGGEPLLNLPTLYHAVTRIRERWPGDAPPVHILVITNGQIYDPQLTDFFKTNRMSVSVSLDGMQPHHDLVRRTTSGQGTFARAAETLKRYTAAGLNTGICLTLGTHNLPDLTRIVEYFADEFGVAVEIQVPFAIPYQGGNQFSVTMKEAAPTTFQAYEKLRDRGLTEGLMLRRVRDLEQGAFRVRDCGAVGGQWVIAPDGMIGPCHALVGERRYFSGDVRAPACSPYSQPAFQEWWSRLAVNLPECRGCPAIALCGGGCPYNALMAHGTIWAPDPQVCGYMQALLDWWIDQVWKQVEARKAQN